MTARRVSSYRKIQKANGSAGNHQYQLERREDDQWWRRHTQTQQSAAAQRHTPEGAEFESFVHVRRVDEDAGEHGLEDDADVHHPVPAVKQRRTE